MCVVQALDLMKPLGFADAVPEMLTSIMPKLSPPDMLAFTQSVTQAMPVKEASKVFTDVLDGLVSITHTHTHEAASQVLSPTSTHHPCLSVCCACPSGV